MAFKGIGISIQTAVENLGRETPWSLNSLLDMEFQSSPEEGHDDSHGEDRAPGCNTHRHPGTLSYGPPGLAARTLVQDEEYVCMCVGEWRLRGIPKSGT